MPNIAPYGSWNSPITPKTLTSETVGLSELCVDGDTLYWLESRPSEGGRTVLVTQSADGARRDVTPAGFNVRNQVHEYGGGSYTVCNGRIFFCHLGDQRVYFHDGKNKPVPLTPENKALRYADLFYDYSGHRLFAIREDHTKKERQPKNTLVSIPLDPKKEIQVLVGETPFCSSPRLSEDGKRLAWIQWNYSKMPWDGSQLWVGDISPEGVLSNETLVAGHDGKESVCQPVWNSSGALYFITDRDGWWNLYRYEREQLDAVWTVEAEFGLPHWQFGMSTYSFVNADQALCSYTEKGQWHLVLLNVRNAKHRKLSTEFATLSSPQATVHGFVFIASHPKSAPAVSRLNLKTGKLETLRSSSKVEVPEDCFSQPELIEITTAENEKTYGWYYPPQNAEHEGPQGELPPLLVKCHGGPTAQATSGLDIGIQYWTSRGFGVLEPNYSGSTGYGRFYRDRLNGNWGVLDVDDCLALAKHLAAQGKVDKNRMAIRGASAGGLTALCALTRGQLFQAAVSYYGVSDLESLVRDTHKFESKYLDCLVGPYPELRHLYDERSPVKNAEKIKAPVLFLQGADDAVVPKNQPLAMIEALKKNGITAEYVEFPGEGHGFRKSETIEKALDTELAFYKKIFQL